MSMRESWQHRKVKRQRRQARSSWHVGEIGSSIGRDRIEELYGSLENAVGGSSFGARLALAGNFGKWLLWSLEGTAFWCGRKRC